ncbi:metallopeptidase family protein [Polymorphum gilvum]|uniref:Conserved domain protein n=1 Tax=Polymorphum gilvum (strain LMG 25793 / CGMCC 1.9160 / SL003B-26A1) TaxID=991905 RepID=F2J300_POLGS|nr:metallopeptidase family protein [Polymorphum gilvum]ADZ68870.1 Conserved domain protein [Polymorphum gilvum SL003B-26A1]
MADRMNDAADRARPDDLLGRWRNSTAPDLETFEALATEAFAALPEAFRSLCADLVITVDEFPSDDMLDSVEAEDPFDLLGLFEGIGFAQGGADLATGQRPNRIWLFRRPILDYWAAYEESLGAVISHVLIHEIGHHFGLSDEDMETIEAAAG